MLALEVTAVVSTGSCVCAMVDLEEIVVIANVRGGYREQGKH
jgi:hypothetical protein